MGWSAYSARHHCLGDFRVCNGQLRTPFLLHVENCVRPGGCIAELRHWVLLSVNYLAILVMTHDKQTARLPGVVFCRPCRLSLRIVHCNHPRLCTIIRGLLDNPGRQLFYGQDLRGLQPLLRRSEIGEDFPDPVQR